MGCVNLLLSEDRAKEVREKWRKWSRKDKTVFVLFYSGTILRVEYMKDMAYCRSTTRCLTELSYNKVSAENDEVKVNRLSVWPYALDPTTVYPLPSPTFLLRLLSSG